LVEDVPAEETRRDSGVVGETTASLYVGEVYDAEEPEDEGVASIEEADEG